MLQITINEIIEEFGYSCKQISDMVGISYNHVLNLKNIKEKYSKNDIKKINHWLNSRGKNIIYKDFQPVNNRKIYEFEQRGIVSLDEYKKRKKKEQRRIDSENSAQERAAFFRELFKD